MLLTIVVPVYRVENYIRRCIDSVLCQINSSIEIILVDDGSPDNSGKICDDYASKYECIQVIHKTNGGLSSARNAGINEARGEYILFLDSDDWLFEGCLNQFLEIIQNYDADLIVGKAKVIDDQGNTFDKLNYTIRKGLYSSEEYISLLNKRKSYSACAPFTLCRTELIRKKNIRFLEGVVQEDELWTPTILLNAETVFFSDVYFYYNFVRNDSITHSTNKAVEGSDLLTVTRNVLELFQTHGIENAQALTDKMVFNYLRAICLVDRFENEKAIFTGRLLRKYAFFRTTKLKALLYSASPGFYLFVHKLVKGC